MITQPCFKQQRKVMNAENWKVEQKNTVIENFQKFLKLIMVFKERTDPKFIWDQVRL